MTLEERLASLEHEERRLRACVGSMQRRQRLVGCGLAGLALTWLVAAANSSDSGELKAQRVVITDSEGKAGWRIDSRKVRRGDRDVAELVISKTSDDGLQEVASVIAEERNTGETGIRVGAEDGAMASLCVQDRLGLGSPLGASTLLKLKRGKDEKEVQLSAGVTGSVLTLPKGDEGNIRLGWQNARGALEIRNQKARIDLELGSPVPHFRLSDNEGQPVFERP